MSNSFSKIYEEIKTRKTKFSFLMSRPQSTQRDEAYYELFEVYKDLVYPQIITLPLEGNNRAMYIETNLLQKVLEHLANKLSTRDGFNKHIADFVQLEIDYKETAPYFSTVNKNKIDLLNAFNKFYTKMKGLADFGWAPIAVEKIIAPQLISMLKKIYPNGEELYYSLASPIKLNQFQKMRIDICDAIIDGAKIEDIAEELENKYLWYNEYSYVEKLCDKEYFIDEISKLTKEKAIEEKNRIQSEIKNNIENVNKIKSKIKDDRINLFADVVVEYTFLRTERVDLFKKLQAPARYIYDLVAELLKEETGMNWTRIEVVNLMNSEIISYLSGSSIPDFEKTKTRNRFLFYRNPSEEFIVEDKIILNDVTKLLQSDNGKQIKGSIAFKGVVKGKVSLVFGKDDLHKIDEGSVLVARTTMPDYIHAMEKAVAFVTEEGGITSHAAIIARELKKPCIVGTGNCTKVLKDGDMVEVDADNGIVRII
jgi:phosphohistidine swiveling domain-containing protein